MKKMGFFTPDKDLTLANSNTILVIDDAMHVRRIIERKLKQRGYDVITAEDGEKGLRLIQAERPDIVISDINMPKLDGKSLCQLTDPLKKERPFLTIVMSARISPDDEIWINELTDTQFMEKPFSPSRLVSAVDQYFDIREQ